MYLFLASIYEPVMDTENNKINNHNTKIILIVSLVISVHGLSVSRFAVQKSTKIVTVFCSICLVSFFLKMHHVISYHILFHYLVISVCVLSKYKLMYVSVWCNDMLYKMRQH